jgi:hypothetical protein
MRRASRLRNAHSEWDGERTVHIQTNGRMSEKEIFCFSRSLCVRYLAVRELNGLGSFGVCLFNNPRHVCIWHSVNCDPRRRLFRH